jgi:hypothetical protein
MSSFNVSELDFAAIKDSIKAHFRSQSKYNDWDFNGSGLSVLLDVLAYNTHYNAMVAHLSLNETFLDSAQIRGNVVSHAKLLGYVPRSLASSKAVINVVVTPGSTVANQATILRGTRFSTVVDQVRYYFVALESHVEPINGGKYTFTNIPVRQGTLKRMIYRVDTSLGNQKFEIPDANIDTSTMRVRLKANTESDSYSIYTQFTSLVNINENSQIYYLQETPQGLYEIYFGDGILGKMPTANNIVEIEYVYTDGTVADGANLFTSVDTISGYSNIAVTVAVDSYGGGVRESIESIRYNAPLTFTAQNRAVTADDYRAIILKNVANVEAISVWGGEDDIVPNFGKVYISVKPIGAETLTTAEKTTILSSVLAGKNVVSITPILVDPEYTYLELDVFFKYNGNLTDRALVELQTIVREAIIAYNNDDLLKFDGVFRHSKLLRQIDTSEPSILNSTIRVYMYKEATPSNTNNNYFDLNFSGPIYQSSSDSFVLSTNAFLVGGIEHYFRDFVVEGSYDRKIFMCKLVNGAVEKVKEVGMLYAATGNITISGFITDTTTPIRFTVVPNSNDIAPKRNQLLSIDLQEVVVVGENDTIAVAGSSGAVVYTTTSRHR